jgi:prepilin peptidase CpaA
MDVVHIILLSVFILICFYTDIKSSRIPNAVTVSGTVIGLLYHLFTNGLEGILSSVIGLIIGFSIFFVLYLFGGVGAGDVKLFAAIGALTGTEFVLYTMMYSILYAGFIGLGILLFKKEFYQRIKNAFFFLFNLLLLRKRELVTDYKKMISYRFPFMYAVLPGVITTLYYFLQG